MRRLVISSDVRKALGQDGVRRLVDGPTLKIVECSVCGKAEDVDQGVAMCVSVEVGGKMTRTRFTHQACAPSIVIPSHPDDYWDRLSNLTAKTIIWGEAAVLLFEPEMPVLGRRNEGADLDDVWTNHFIEAGFQRYILGSPLETLKGWVLEVNDSTLVLREPNGSKHTINFHPQEPVWLEALWSKAACLVITGTSLHSEQFDEDEMRAALREGRAVVAAIEAIQGDYQAPG